MRRITGLLTAGWLMLTILAAGGEDAPAVPGPPYRAPRQMATAAADGALRLAIVANPDGQAAEAPAELQKRLREAWGVELPILAPAEARRSGRVLLLAGNVFANDLTRQLLVRGRLSGDAGELRAITNPPAPLAGVVFVGGPDGAARAWAADRLLARFPKLPAEIPAFGERAGAAADVEALLKLRRNSFVAQQQQRPGSGNSQAMIGLLGRLAADYRETGDGRVIGLFLEELRYLKEKYFSLLDFRSTSPHFVFYRLCWALDTVEVAPEFDDDAQRLAAETVALISAHIYKNGDMRLPRQLYKQKKTQFLTNHPAFAIQSIYFAAEYFLRRYPEFAPARGWEAIALHNFQGIAGQPFSPEDSLPYQFHVRNIFLNFAVGSGRYGAAFFRTPEQAAYLAYAKSLIDPRGGVPGLGDTYPVGRSICRNGLDRFLKSMSELFGDRDSDFYRQRLAAFQRRYGMDSTEAPPADAPKQPAGRTTGWLIFPLRQEKLAGLRFPASLPPVADRRAWPAPPLDKAVFRSGWDPEASDYACIGGINGGPHGHYDAGALIHYLSGGRQWIADGDYVHRSPAAHNTVMVWRDGKTELELPRLAQTVGAAESPDGRAAALTVRVDDLNGADWRRHFRFDEGEGFWCVDELTATAAADWRFACRWRILCRAGAADGASGRFAQRREAAPEPFGISAAPGPEASFRLRFDAGSNAREEGYFGAYRPDGAEHTAELTQFWPETRLPAGAVRRFVNFCAAGALQRVTPLAGGDAWRTAGAPQRLAVRGKFRAANWEIDADWLTVSPRGVLAVGATRIAAPGIAPFQAETPRNLWLPIADLKALTAALAALPAAEPPPAADAPAAPAALPRTVATGTAVTALAASRDAFAVGTADGTVIGYAPDGAERFRWPAGSRVSALAAVDDGAGGENWAVGIEPAPGANSRATGEIALLTPDGKPLWRSPTFFSNVHRGLVRTLFAAREKNSGEPPKLVAGVSSWHYLVYDQRDGRLLRRMPVLHEATAGAAGDLDGDGVDEIVAGSQYMQNTLFRLDGRRLFNRNAGPWCRAAATVDFTGAGVRQAALARETGRLSLLAAPDWDGRTVELGGMPLGIAVLADGGREVLLTAAESGELRRIDGRSVRRLTPAPFPLEAFASTTDRALGVSPDGRTLHWNAAGEVVSRGRLAFDPAAVTDEPVRAAVNRAGQAVSRGRELFFQPR